MTAVEGLTSFSLDTCRRVNDLGQTSVNWVKDPSGAGPDKATGWGRASPVPSKHMLKSILER